MVRGFGAGAGKLFTLGQDKFFPISDRIKLLTEANLWQCHRDLSRFSFQVVV
jgi:hypothetical protein